MRLAVWGLNRLAGMARLTACLAVLAWAGQSIRPAQAGPLVTDGTFQQTTTTSPGGYLCQVATGTVCTSQLTDWMATCSSVGCSSHASPSSILFAGTTGGAFNGGIGLYWNDAAGHAIGNVPGGGNAIALDGDAR